MLRLEIATVDWALREPFMISRETITSIACIQVTLTDTLGNRGRGEAAGIDYAGETPATMMAQIEVARRAIEVGIARDNLHLILPYGGARNAVDCAMWDLEAKQSGVRVWQKAGLDRVEARTTAFSFGIMDEAELRAKAPHYSDFPLLKIKTNRDRGLDPIRILCEELPHARFIVDPNQSWGATDLLRYAPDLEALNVTLLEQPVAVADDEVLLGLSLPVPVAADEAFNTRADIDSLVGKYQVLNIKLDKTGGLTEALACAKAGKAAGFNLMVGCMVGSSLSMAPGVLVAQLCDYVDLDGPLLQANDVEHPVTYKNGMIAPPTPQLWG